MSEAAVFSSVGELKLVFYGRLADRLGHEILISAPPEGCSIAELRDIIAQEHPHAATDICDASVKACVGDMFVQDSFRVSKADSVEFFPPVSGG